MGDYRNFRNCSGPVELFSEAGSERVIYAIGINLAWTFHDSYKHGFVMAFRFNV